MPRCSNCNLILSRSETEGGKCPTCGGQVSGMLAEPATYGLGAVGADSTGRRGLQVHWGFFVGALIALLVGLNYFCYEVFIGSPNTQSRSRRGRALESLLGKELIAGIFVVVMVGYCVYRCLKNASSRGKWIVGGILGAGTVAILAAWITPALRRGSETAWQQQIANEVKGLPFKGRHENEAADEAIIRDKVLVWDGTTAALSKAQQLLPAARLPNAGDEAFSVVLILKTENTQTETYTSGEPGYKRTLTIRVIDYPEKKVRDHCQVIGNSPGAFVMRPSNAKGPIVGDTDEPLKKWIESKSERK